MVALDGLTSSFAVGAAAVEPGRTPGCQPLRQPRLTFPVCSRLRQSAATSSAYLIRTEGPGLVSPARTPELTERLRHALPAVRTRSAKRLAPIGSSTLRVDTPDWDIMPYGH